MTVVLTIRNASGTTPSVAVEIEEKLAARRARWTWLGFRRQHYDFEFAGRTQHSLFALSGAPLPTRSQRPESAVPRAR
jgi:hypothetical protein